MSVILISSDQQRFEVAKESLRPCNLIYTMLDEHDDSHQPTIPLLEVKASILIKALGYCHHHRNDPVQEEDGYDHPRAPAEDISEWDREFYNVDGEKIFELIMAANYLDIKGMLDVGCKVVANMIKGKSVQEISALFKITNEFTPEEEEQIRLENQWAEAEPL